MKKLLAIIALMFAQPLAAHEPATASYLGNEGVFIQQGQNKILFDAFYLNSYGNYVLVDEETSKAMMAGDAPYDGVSALFVSHVHGDHFSPAPTIAYLQAQTNVTLYGSMQVKQAIVDMLGDPNHKLLERVIGVAQEPGDKPQRFVQGNLKISVVAIPHSGGERMAKISNLAFRVSLGGHPTVMHLGDADGRDVYFASYQDYWDEEALNIAFPPYWFYHNEESRLILKNRLKAQQAIGIHVPAKAIGHGDEYREEIGGDVFTDPGETRNIPMLKN